MVEQSAHIFSWFGPLLGIFYLISGTVIWVVFAPMKMSLGGPRRPKKRPILARHCHIGHKWFHLPQMGSTLVKLGSTLYFMSGTVIWEFFVPMKMSLGVPWKWLFCPKISILAISDWSPLKWAHHWMNMVEYFISHPIVDWSYSAICPLSCSTLVPLFPTHLGPPELPMSK